MIQPQHQRNKLQGTAKEYLKMENQHCINQDSMSDLTYRYRVVYGLQTGRLSMFSGALKIYFEPCTNRSCTSVADEIFTI